MVPIAGNGHVRKDVGVARWLNQIAPILTVRSEGFVEGGDSAGRYDAAPQLKPQQRDDPCAKFKTK